MTQMVYLITLSTPLGDMSILATSKGICMASFPGHDKKVVSTWAIKNFGGEILTDQTIPSFLLVAKQQIENYFNGDKTPFIVPFDFYGTPFQKQVWDLLLSIPYGTTKSYKQIAQLINKPQAIRAVGTACGANPIAILVPCHRVISSSGSLTGYAGGIESKSFLLNLEQGRLPLF